jgi:hypothetical protein
MSIKIICHTTPRPSCPFTTASPATNLPHDRSDSDFAEECQRQLYGNIQRKLDAIEAKLKSLAL